MDRWADAVIRFLASLTFGGMLGGGVTGALHSVIWASNPEVAFNHVLLSGILIGSALHKPLAWGWRQFLGPIAALGTSVLQVRKLQYYADSGLIPPEKFKELVGKVIEDDILGEQSARRLPPGD